MGMNRWYLRHRLHKLKEFMINTNIPCSYYSIGDYLDEAVCIEFIDNKWIIYEGERGNKYNLKTYRSFSQVCDDFFSRIAETEQQEKCLKALWNSKNVRPLTGIKRERRPHYVCLALITTARPKELYVGISEADKSVKSDISNEAKKGGGKNKKLIKRKVSNVPKIKRGNRSRQMNKKWKSRG